MRRILWAIDPFKKDKKLQRESAWAISALTRGVEAVVDPVYLWSAYSLDAPMDVSGDALAQTQASAQIELKRILKPVPLRGIQPLKVLVEPYLPQRAMVSELLNYAKRSYVDLIVLSSRAQKGIKRWVMGSFAETLALHSDIPLLVVSPEWTPVAMFEHILFPTDFSKESKQAFKKVILLAKTLGCDLRIYHKLRYELTPTLDVLVKNYPQYRETLQKEIAARRSAALKLAKNAEIAGVRTSVVIDYKTPGSVSEGILRAVKQKRGFIAMASHSGGFARALMGSATRTVIRESRWPVWVVRPRHKFKSQAIDLIV